MNRVDRRRFVYLVVMFAACTLFYYFGEVVDLFGWEALRFEFFYGVHDTHRLLFLVPILYAAHYYGVKASVIVTIIAVNTFIPRALFFSPYPDPLLRTIIFILVAGVVGHLLGRATTARRRLEARIVRQRRSLRALLDELAPAYLIVGPDRIIRYISPALERHLGEGVGWYCHRYLRGFQQPCPDGCGLAGIITGTTRRMDYLHPEVAGEPGLAFAYLDTDGAICQLTVFPGIGRE